MTGRRDLMFRRILKIGALLPAVIFLSVGLDRMPPPWWDEGWTLTVARTWIERGFYGMLRDDAMAPVGLAAAFPTPWLSALGMQLFGIGLAQGRLASALLTGGALTLLFLLTRKLYNRTVAWGTLGVLFWMTMHPHMHPLIMGRQVLGEAAQLFFVTAGFFALTYAEQKAGLVIPLTALCWSLAFISKAQTIPFLALAIVVVAVASALAQKWRTTIVFVAVGGIAYLFYRLIPPLLVWILGDNTIAAPSLSGLLEALAFVPLYEMRVKAITLVFGFSLALVCGVAYGSIAWFRIGSDMGLAQWIQLALWTLVCSWLVWFVVLANSSIPRYLYPPTFFGAVFVAALLDRFALHYSARETLARVRTALRTRQWGRDAVAALAAIFLVALTVPFTLLVLFWSFTLDSNQAAKQTADYLNMETVAAARIETYEAELFFYLKRAYHYPPDQTHVDYIRRTLYPEQPIEYNPLESNPDYLVDGPSSRSWGVYDAVLSNGEFMPLVDFGVYHIYVRQR